MRVIFSFNEQGQKFCNKLYRCLEKEYKDELSHQYKEIFESYSEKEIDDEFEQIDGKESKELSRTEIKKLVYEKTRERFKREEVKKLNKNLLIIYWAIVNKIPIQFIEDNKRIPSNFYFMDINDVLQKRCAEYVGVRQWRMFISLTFTMDEIFILRERLYHLVAKFVGKTNWVNSLEYEFFYIACTCLYSHQAKHFYALQLYVGNKYINKMLIEYQIDRILSEYIDYPSSVSASFWDELKKILNDPREIMLKEKLRLQPQSKQILLVEMDEWLKSYKRDSDKIFKNKMDLISQYSKRLDQVLQDAMGKVFASEYFQSFLILFKKIGRLLNNSAVNLQQRKSSQDPTTDEIARYIQLSNWIMRVWLLEFKQLTSEQKKRIIIKIANEILEHPFHTSIYFEVQQIVDELNQLTKIAASAATLSSTDAFPVVLPASHNEGITNFFSQIRDEPKSTSLPKFNQVNREPSIAGATYK